MEFFFGRSYNLVDLNIFLISGYLLGIGTSFWTIFLVFVVTNLAKMVLEAMFYS